MNRRTFLKKSFASLLAFFGLGGGTYYYAREMEPSMLTIHQTSLSSAGIPASFHNFTVLQFSDTHVGFQYTLEQLDELVTKINNLNPDMIVFTGDLVDMPDRFDWHGELVSILSKLNPSFGKYWIYGNHDHGGYGTEIVEERMEAAGFTLLMNQHTVISNGEDSITLIGLDDVMLGAPDVEEATAGMPENGFSLLLVHEPDYADVVKQYPVDVQLSGHSHGGQVRIPFIGHIYTPSFAEKYVDGHYQVSEDFQLFVSRGVGTTRLPYRFLCRPEITLYTLKSESQT